MASKTPTQRGVSLLLNKAGFKRSVSSGTRIRGLRSNSDGYSVQGAYEGVVWVRHEVTSFRPLSGDEVRIKAMLAKYATAIEAAGFAVERGSDRLVVTAKEA